MPLALLSVSDKSGLVDVLRAYIMGDVDQASGWRNAQDHALHRADVAIGQAEVGRQGDRGERGGHAGS